MKKNRCERPLRLEPLENRMTFSGNVTAYVSGANLVILGDNQPNEVAVFQLGGSAGGIPAGAYIVTGGTGGGE